MGNNKKTVAVIFGGKSCEHDISIITGALVLNCIDKQTYDPLPVYIKDGVYYTGDKLFDVGFYNGFDEHEVKKVAFIAGQSTLYHINGQKIKPFKEIYCAINCCHGLNGEDGSIAGLMRLCGIPFASPDMLSSSVCMDKAATKTFLEGMGVKVLPCKVVQKGAFYQNRELVLGLAERQIGYPCIVKPARLGSSIGIKIAKDRAQLVTAIEYALRFDCKIIIEKAVEGFTEINCAAYRYKGRIVVSDCENPKPSGDILSFDDKYISGLKQASLREFPANIKKELSDKIRETTGAVYRKLYINGVVRIDYLVCGEDVYLNEVNTVPGSLGMYLFKDSVGQFYSMISELIEEGVKEYRDYENGAFSFRSNVLGSIGSKNMGVKHSTSR